MFRSLLLAGLLAVPTAALACKNAVRLSNSRIAQGIEAANGLLAKGDFQGAANAITAAFPEGLKRAPSASKKHPDVLKAQATVAIAIVRSNDTVKVAKPKFIRRGLKSAPARMGEMKWAMERLIAWSGRAPDEPARKAWLAEGQFAVGKADAARATLEALAKDDLLAEAFSWRTLSLIRAKAGDAAGATAATNRCKAISGDAAYCTADPGLGGS